MHLRLILIGTVYLTMMTFFSFGQEILNPKFEKKVNNLINHSVSTISCERLYTKLNTPNLYILDAREKPEFEVSHLNKARWVGYNTFSEESLADIPKDATIVIYCSVGYRSEKVGEQLLNKGYKRVYNLLGGIFEWTNRAYQLVDKTNSSTDKVHPYDAAWGKWLDKGNKVYKNN
jgi:rhodanese-related sulfurtransferase